MMKQSKNKKGRLAKSTLSVVLAASMVLTSSSFVWASPVIEEVEPTAIVEEAAPEMVGAADAVYVDEAGIEENVGAASVTLETDGTDGINVWGSTITASASGFSDGDVKYAFYIADTANTEGTEVQSFSATATYKTQAAQAGKFIYAVAKDNSNSVKSDYFEIKKHELTDSADEKLTVTFKSNDDIIYDGTAKKPEITKVEYDEDGSGNTFTAVELKEYDLDYTENKNAGTAKVQIILKGDAYTGTLEKEFTIKPMDISKYSAQINNTIGEQTFGSISPNLITDVTFTKTNSSYKGAAEVHVTGADNFGTATYGTPNANSVATITAITAAGSNLTGTVSTVTGNKTFDVVSATIDPVVTMTKGSFTYGETAIDTKDKVKALVAVQTAAVGGQALVLDTDYEVSVPDDYATVGTKTLIVTGKGSYKFTKTVTYTVNPATTVTVGLASTTAQYTGEAIKPAVTFTGLNGVTPKENVDYVLTYKNNVNVYQKNPNTPGYAEESPQVEITFKGSLNGTKPVTKYFTITPLALINANTTVVMEDNARFTYDGTAKSPTVSSVTVAVPGKTLSLTEGTDFDVVLKADSVTINGSALTADGEAVDYGAYKAEVVPKGNFDGAAVKTVEFQIQKKAFSAETVEIKANTMSLTGASVTPTFVVKDKETGALVPDSNYDVKYIKGNGVETDFPSEIGDYTATLVAKDAGNYIAGGKVNAPYSIVAFTLEAAVVGFAPTGDFNTTNNTFVYDPSKGQVPVVDNIKINGSGNDIKNDCTIVAPKPADAKNVGTYTISITGKGLYAQTITRTYDIVAKELSSDMVKSVKAEMLPDGTYAAPYATVTDSTYTLVQDKDYTVVPSADGKTATITGIGNYKSTKPVVKNIEKVTSMSIANPAITATVNAIYTFDGKAKDPTADLVLKVGATPLVLGRDYTVGNATSNINAGTAKITVNGAGSYANSSRIVEFTIEAADITTAYTIDNSKAPKITINAVKATVDSSVKTASGFITRVAGAATSAEDYILEYLYDGKTTTTFTNAGDYTVNVIGKGNYKGTLAGSFHIDGTQISTAATVDVIADQDYTGKAIEPTVTVKAKTAGLTLKEGTDYTVSYKNNTDIGEAFAIVTGKGKYEGTILSSFNIKGTDISEATVAVDGTYSYTGKAITPKVTVKVGDTVIDPANYDVVATDNTNAGTAKFTVVGKNNCTGTTKEATFEIGKADQKLAVSKTITNALKVRNTNANTYTLKVTGADTALTYKSSNTKIASVNAAGKISFKHVCGKATITVTAAADDNHNAATLKVAVAVKPATPKITVASRSKGFNVKATAVKDITGYQVGYSTDKNFAASKTTKKLAATTKALNKNYSGLAAKKGYYIRVRAYKKVGTTVYWGNWTSAKKITTK